MTKKYIKTKKELAENLKLARQISGLNQEQIANILHVERSTYAYYEVGKTEPDIQSIIQLCKLYEIEVTDLITRDGMKKLKNKMRA